MTVFEVELEEHGDDLLLPLPEEVLNSLNLDIGDTIVFAHQEDGTFKLTKKE